MKFAFSNIALPSYAHSAELRAAAEIGFEGIEVAPSRQWAEVYGGVSAKDVELYRADIETAGLQCVGLHSLLYGLPDLGLFANGDRREDLMAFMVRLSAICRDLGGRTLIWGGGRNRGSLSLPEANEYATEFLREFAFQIEGHGTVLCFEPLGPGDSDFINSVYDSITTVKAVDHPAVQVQLDAKALMQNDEVSEAVFTAAAPYLVHFHVNEPDLGVLDDTGLMPHSAIARLLAAIEYKGFVSLEQKQIRPHDGLRPLVDSFTVLQRVYV